MAEPPVAADQVSAPDRCLGCCRSTENGYPLERVTLRNGVLVGLFGPGLGRRAARLAVRLGYRVDAVRLCPRCWEDGQRRATREESRRLMRPGFPKQAF